jgi:hypothetical protein
MEDLRPRAAYWPKNYHQDIATHYRKVIFKVEYAYTLAENPAGACKEQHSADDASGNCCSVRHMVSVC